MPIDNSAFDKAIETVLDAPKHDFPAKIGSFNVASGTEDIVYSPIDSTIIFGRLQDPEPGTVKRAVQVANETFATWSKVSSQERKKIFDNFRKLLEPRLYRMAAEVVLSTGMSRECAFNEANRTLNLVKKAQEFCEKQTKPLGVWAVVSIRSSPLASSIGYAAMAIATGNTVVLIPSGACPKPVYSVLEVFKNAGLPDGVLNVVCDRVDNSVSELSNVADIQGMVASGCGEQLEETMFLAVDDELHFINEAKGQNPAIVQSPGDVNNAVSAIIKSQVAGTGTGLYQCSKIIAEQKDERPLVNSLIEKLKDLKIGDPTYSENIMGPLLNQKSEKEFLSLIDKYQNNIVFGGKKIKADADGIYYSPILLTGLNEDDDLLFEDATLPVIIVKSYATVDDLEEELNMTDCGLSVGLFSTDSKTISVVENFAKENNLLVWKNEDSMSLDSGSKIKFTDFCKN